MVHRPMNFAQPLLDRPADNRLFNIHSYPAVFVVLEGVGAGGTKPKLVNIMV